MSARYARRSASARSAAFLRRQRPGLGLLVTPTFSSCSTDSAGLSGTGVSTDGAVTYVLAALLTVALGGAQSTLSASLLSAPSACGRAGMLWGVLEPAKSLCSACTAKWQASAAEARPGGRARAHPTTPAEGRDHGARHADTARGLEVPGANKKLGSAFKNVRPHIRTGQAPCCCVRSPAAACSRTSEQSMRSRWCLTRRRTAQSPVVWRVVGRDLQQLNSFASHAPEYGSWP